MGRRPKIPIENSANDGYSYPPASDPTARENQCINLAMNLAEQQLRDGTASSQVIVQFLKMGSPEERLRRDIMEQQRRLLEAKTNAVESAARMEEMYSQAMNAMKAYRGDDEDI